MSAKMQALENWDDLRYFLAVARHGGLAPAARALAVNQSTVFRRIAQLEDNLDARLFDRQPRGYALTGVGEEMLQLASQVEDNVLALHRTVRGADTELRGTVRIATVDELLVCVAPHLKSFREQFPGIDLAVNSEQRVASLARREADVALRPGLAPTEPEVVGRRLVSLPTAAYASTQYLKGRRRPRKPASLRSHERIAFHQGHPSEQHLLEIAADAPVVFRANSMSGQAVAARAGLGVAFLPRFMGDPDPLLERLFAMELPQAFELWLLIHSDLRQTARVRAFVDFLSEAIVSDRSLYEGA